MQNKSEVDSRKGSFRSSFSLGICIRDSRKAHFPQFDVGIKILVWGNSPFLEILDSHAKLQANQTKSNIGIKDEGKFRIRRKLKRTNQTDSRSKKLRSNCSYDKSCLPIVAMNYVGFLASLKNQFKCCPAKE